ncbi:hypothetical protein [Streptomyces sp. CBMA156]|uniref:hypothetical protein n=1 Tax=Streptomyces sp. CBMA156 TaxID=1930280 RepID=UPI001662122F|nr:hypothetical protein [Streptomyces sp. CBMA156]MBD0671008.1 hypothetical protein [Streptomyces sp. CBMA156]
MADDDARLVQEPNGGGASPEAGPVTVAALLGLSGPVMAEVRRRAVVRGVTATAIMREWIEAAVVDPGAPVPLSVITAAAARYQQHRRTAHVQAQFERDGEWGAVADAERLHAAEEAARTDPGR